MNRATRRRALKGMSKLTGIKLSRLNGIYQKKMVATFGEGELIRRATEIITEGGKK